MGGRHVLATVTASPTSFRILTSTPPPPRKRGVLKVPAVPGRTSLRGGSCETVGKNGGLFSDGGRKGKPQALPSATLINEPASQWLILWAVNLSPNANQLSLPVDSSHRAQL